MPAKCAPVFVPPPLQRPHPPIYVGGESEPALRRVAALADGWYGYNLTPSEFEESLARLDAHLEAAGRTRAGLRIAVSPNRTRIDPDTTAAYFEAGADQLIMPLFAGSLTGLDERIDRLRASTGLD